MNFSSCLAVRLKAHDLTDMLLTARGNIQMKIYIDLEQAREQDLTWADLNFNTVAWVTMILLENGIKVEGLSGRPINNLEFAKVICRLVFRLMKECNRKDWAFL